MSFLLTDIVMVQIFHHCQLSLLLPVWKDWGADRYIPLWESLSTPWSSPQIQCWSPTHWSYVPSSSESASPGEAGRKRGEGVKGRGERRERKGRGREKEGGKRKEKERGGKEGVRKGG